MTDSDVIVAGAGPTGLMLAAELSLAGVSPLVLERQPQLGGVPKAYGLSGQILQLLRYRGLLQRLDAVGAGVGAAPAFPFGGLEVDLTALPDPPLRALRLPQRRLERLLDEYVREQGVPIRRGHAVTGARQHTDGVTVDITGPEGPYRLEGRYLVGCDGAHSRVRTAAGIAFTGTTYPEVNRLGQVTVPAAVTVLDNGNLDVPGVGIFRKGLTRTGQGVFAFGRLGTGDLLIQTTEDGPDGIDEDEPMTLDELRESIRRVLGTDIPLGEPVRLSRYQVQARQAEQYRNRRILLAGDAAHLFPATGMGLNVGMLDAANLAWKLAADIAGWAPAGLLDTYHAERHYAGERALLQTRAQAALRRGDDADADALRRVFAELLLDEQPRRRLAALIAGTDLRYPLPNPNDHPLVGTFAPDLPLRTAHGTTSVAELMRTGRAVLLDLTDRPELRRVAHGWRDRVDIHTAETDQRPADALLIRPDAHVAWAAALDEPVADATATLSAALSHWFGHVGPS